MTIILPLSVLNSCNDWEDENLFGPGPNPGPDVVMLLKERVITPSNGIETVTNYTYDNNGRVKTAKSLANEELVADVVYNYPTPNELNAVMKQFLAGEVVSTTYISQVVEGNQVSTVFTYEYENENMPDGSQTMNMTFSAPCGIDTNVMSTEMMGQSFDSTSVFEYTDNNCSYKMTTDGVLAETATKDDKYAPFSDPLVRQLGITEHNIVTSVDHMQGTTENISYTYNENGYPVTANHTYSGTEGAEGMNFSETFTYFD